MRITFTILFLFISACWQIIHAQQKSKKDYKNGVPIEKGLWFTGGTISLGSKDAENETQVLGNVVNQNKRDFEVRVDAGYVTKPNLAFGMGLLYGGAMDDIEQQNALGGSTLSNLNRKYYAFRPFVRNFIPLGSVNRFYVIIPTELQIGFGNTQKKTTSGLLVTNEKTTTQYYGLAMRPGLLVFIVKNFGFEVNVGAFGLGRRIEKTTASNRPDARVITNDLDLKINLLNLSLGFAGYF
jgi:hypothetical protein